MVALGVALIGASGCGGSKSQGGGANRVAAADFRFAPNRLEIKRGQTVTWTNTGQTAHTVKGPGFFSTRAIDPGRSYSFRFAKPGSYPYLCTLHPTQMKRVIVVS